MSAPEPAGPASSDFAPPHWIVLASAALLYSIFIVAQWSEAYLDFGDGNYLYIATRLAEGVVVYRDLLAPQPPCHLFVGAALVKLSQLFAMESPLYLFRAFSLLLHLGSFLLVVGLARECWASARIATLAGVIFLMLPIGLWWSMGFQSEPLEIFLLLTMLALVIKPTRGRDVLAGVFGALAALTNATAAPFLLVLIVYMVFRNPRRAAWIAAPALALAAATTVLMELWSQGSFLDNVLFDQAGSFGSLSYAVGKLQREGRDIVYLEGVFIVLAALGLVRFLRESPLEEETRGGMAWFFVATMASLLYVTKGGTVDYIYCLAEPALAILAAGEIVALVRRLGPRSWGLFPPKIAAAALLILIGLGPSVIHYIRLWNQVAFELPDYDPKLVNAEGRPLNNVQEVKRWIERYSRPGDTILCPPFYAFLTGRKIWGEYCEIYLWTVKSNNDRVAGDFDGEGWTKAREMARAIRQKQLPLVIIELDQTGHYVPEVTAALAEFYEPILEEPYRTLNTRLGVYIPKGARDAGD